tara:strand:+ start:1357 stop:1710 length:354 start_codon:yes stop_codon:yes gene_type:complete
MDKKYRLQNIVEKMKRRQRDRYTVLDCLLQKEKEIVYFSDSNPHNISITDDDKDYFNSLITTYSKDETPTQMHDVTIKNWQGDAKLISDSLIQGNPNMTSEEVHTMTQIALSAMNGG